MKRCPWLIALTALLSCVSLGRAAEVSGRVRAVGRHEGDAVTTIVYAESLTGPSPVRPGRYKHFQRNKSFTPRALAVPFGSTVDFVNEDEIYHNVFSLAPTPFDLGLYRAGASKSRVFSEPATYRVFCNIHPQMTALLAVVPSPYFALTEGGTFRLDVPAGTYRLTAFSERAAAVTAEVRVGSDGATAPIITLDESSFVPTDHTNKYGQPYPKDAYIK